MSFEILQEVTPEEQVLITELVKNQYQQEGRLKLPAGSFHQSGGNPVDLYQALETNTLTLEDFQRQADGTIHCIFRPTSGTGGIMNFFIKPEALEAFVIKINTL